MTDHSEPTEKQQPAHFFKKGVSGNPAGRPKGSRNKLGEAFLADLLADFQAHGPKVIAAVRETKPDVYLRVVTSILPQQVEVRVDPLEEMKDADLDRYIRQLASAVARFEQLEAGAGPSVASEAPATTH